MADGRPDVGVPLRSRSGAAQFHLGRDELAVRRRRRGRADPELHPDDEVLQALEETRKLVEAAAVGPSQADRIPHYDALFQNWTDNGWNHHIAQYSAGWAGQGNMRGFEFRDVDGWIVGDGVKYLWFDT